ncbi:MAG: Major Facilitator Superfamily transporter [Rickettsiales bacterium]|jgi:MFS family permease|nr:Major Facilitator Superfamily transporter [Rickettsiales bacterium]
MTTSEKIARFEKQAPILIIEGVASSMMDALTTGTLLVGIALTLNASSLVIGILGALPFLTSIIQIPAIFLVEKYRNRKQIVLIACWIARTTLLGVAILYFIPSPSIALMLFLVLCSVRFMGSAVAACAWNSWMNDVIPKDRLGKYFGWRMLFSTIASTVLMFAASVFLEWWEQHYPRENLAPYAILFTLGFVWALVTNSLISRLYHPPIPESSIDRFTQHFTLDDLYVPLRHENFRRLIIFMALWSFSVNLASPFFAAFMIQSLGYTMSDVIRLTVITQIIYTFTLHIWGHYSDRFSNKAIIRICGPIFAFCFLGWTFTTFPTVHSYTWTLILVLHILMGLATSGINLASNNIALKLCPDEHSTSFLAVNNLISSISAGLAPLIGGAVVFWVKEVNLETNIHISTPNFSFILPLLSLTGWDFLFLLAFLLAFVSLAYLFRLQEEGDVNRTVLLRTLIFDTARFLYNISTVTAFRTHAGIPRSKKPRSPKHHP